MSLLEPFSKPRWQHRDPEVRLAAVQELADEAVLLEVLQADEDPAVRSRALSRIDAPATLDRLIDATPAWLSGSLLQQARAQRLRQLLPEPGVLPPETDDATLLRVTALADDVGLIEAAIGRIESPQLRLDLATGHPLAHARLSAARSIDDIELLQRLIQQSRHKDKSVFRHCRERLDAHLAAQRSAEERQQSLVRLAEDAAALRAAVDAPANVPECRARCLALQERWANLREHAMAEEQERIQGDLDACVRRIEERVTAEAAELAARSAAEEQKQAQAAAAANAFAALLDELTALDPAVLSSSESAKAVEGQINGIEERWVSALRLAHPAPEQTETCKARLSEWRAALQITRRLAARHGELGRLLEAAAHLDPADYRTIEKLLQQTAKLARALPWPEGLQAAMPEAIGRLREQHALLEQRIASLAGKEPKTLEKVEAAFATFRGELATSHFRNADRALNRLRNLLRALPPARQDHFQHELRPLLARLQEIHDWQGFAIEPKKKELVERMKALVGSTDDADALAAKIKALQDEWKQLGPLSPRKDQTLWRAFSGAAEEAWAPCKDAFEQRAGVRKQLFQQRMQLVAQLIDYEQKIAWPDREQQRLERPDAEQPAPSPPEPDQPATGQGARGDPGTELPAPDWNMVRKTLNTARQAFRELGPVDRKQERKSQKALDKVCDRIYAHLEKEYARNIEGKKALIAEAQALAGQDDLRQAIDRAKAIQREWKDLGPTPQRVDRGLWKDFRSACDAVFARMGEEREQRNAGARARAEQRQAQERARTEQAAARLRQKQERWQRLLDRMQACGLKASDPEKAAALWGEDGELPKGIDAAALGAWWMNGPGGSGADTLREACIALEVLAGIESPPEEKQARMAYQMKRLVEGMGSGPGDSGERLLEAINRFIALRPSADWLGRFGRAVEAARGVS